MKAGTITVPQSIGGVIVGEREILAFVQGRWAAYPGIGVDGWAVTDIASGMRHPMRFDERTAKAVAVAFDATGLAVSGVSNNPEISLIFEAVIGEVFDGMEAV